ncbi:MAG TPA: hypothetical protein HA360_01305 [Nanoarchaeota archaeon]|nr:hypothetical protein [Candidatus Woesearchaeota archaeon]HIH15658.1 hypothetical protein [Nanoarchaeota archaeon]HIH58767.1 hypothetical protein [Nanoarchaeota archaeon]HII13689.1 hypothetical protein [Nanoarchaeota archaeon]HIJ05375.1 hypothetical protein [Nanoarchaeota archaeon]
MEKSLNKQGYINVHMSTQISIKLSDKMYKSAKQFADKKGFDSLQDFIRETLREKLFEGESLSGKNTALASQKSLAKNWLKKEEDEAWKHLQKGK